MKLQGIQTPDYVRIVTEETTVLTENRNGRFYYEDVEVGFLQKETEIQINMTAKQSPVNFIVLRWNVELTGENYYLGDAFERGYGTFEWRHLNPHRVMPWYFLISNKAESSGIGVMVRPNAMCFWMCDSQGITLWLDVRSGVQGLILQGKELDVATVVWLNSNEKENAYTFAKRFCRSLCNDPLLPDAPVYGSNNWYYAYGNSSAEEILEDTVLLAELTEGIDNRPFMVIDDCWQELALTKGAAGRPYERGNVRFPDMELLASKIKAANIRPGIWIRPLETNEMFLSKELRALRHRNALDPSVPEVLELIGEDIRRVTSWGYELVKYDFATFDFYGAFYPEGKEVLKQKGWTLHNRSMTSAECIKALYKTLHDNANGAVLIGCNVIGHLAAGLIHLHRSGDDTSGNSFDRTAMMGVNTLAFRLPQHKAFFDIDADCVGITENIPWEYNKRFLDLLANSGTPLFISAKPSAMTQEMKKDLNAAFQKAALQKNQMEPLDWFETTLPEKYYVDGEIKQYKWIESSGLNSFCSL